ncbi:tRNA glutamyl-Q(34) synthetase GluQRS [Undibacterium sp. Jales W-56]|uniref:tRNA glutamyl-Q(34) synthetase GluQRS n=1 Tax=Undibacterium sp. Jales W-56 TaxID=2897325 RepID=UPI0021CEF32D|nr:tRNA glutamyl-Q(34) synthetase GluQRS [Undibacterium sp. Jales W-56]MCU6434441.1 tRNA glutamyl-Q(34) synthetase GluQRS [Undibacterium sp. Jales W-56]
MILSRPRHYIGRFAPSPTGPLHMGSLVAAMASYLDAKAHRGQWLLRIEDLDFDRNAKDADQMIIDTLRRCQMQWDGAIAWQSQRSALYEAALQQLGDAIYPCACSRREIADSRLNSQATSITVYPGTCRNGLPAGRQPRSWRLKVPAGAQSRRSFDDRWMGRLSQDLATEVGDFVLKRADGFWAYQLAVVVDDAAQGVTDVVRGADLLDSTARQMYLQELLGLPYPRYLHIPVVANANGEKLSKQTGAQAIDVGGSEKDVLQHALLPAAHFLGLHHLAGTDYPTISSFWQQAISAWQQLLEEHSNTATASAKSAD